MNTYTKFIQSIEKEKNKIAEIREQCVYYRQKLPDMFLLTGMMSFMMLSMIGLMIFLAYALLNAETGNLNLMLVRIIWVFIAFVSWFIIGPLHVLFYRRKNKHISDSMKTQTMLDGMLSWFSLTQQLLNITVRNDIMEKALCEVQDRQAIKTKMNNKMDSSAAQNHTNESQIFLENLDAQLTDFINNKYAIIYFFESFLSRDMWKLAIEGMLTGFVMTLLCLFPYFDPKNQPINIWLFFIVLVVGFIIPYFCHCITFFWHKRAF